MEQQHGDLPLDRGDHPVLPSPNSLWSHGGMPLASHF
jgi:hypothetical protein